MHRIRQVSLVLITITLVVGCAVPVVGQEPSFVYVSFAFQSKKAAKVFNTEQDQREAEKKIGRELAQRCKTKFRYWQFVLHRCANSRSEEHTSELQSRGHLVCRLQLEKKKPLTR